MNLSQPPHLSLDFDLHHTMAVISYLCLCPRQALASLVQSIPCDPAPLLPPLRLPYEWLSAYLALGWFFSTFASSISLSKLSSWIPYLAAYLICAICLQGLAKMILLAGTPIRWTNSISACGVPKVVVRRHQGLLGPQRPRKHR